MARNKARSPEEIAAINHRAAVEGARDPEGTLTLEGISVAEAARRHAEQSRAWHEQLIANAADTATTPLNPANPSDNESSDEPA